MKFSQRYKYIFVEVVCFLYILLFVYAAVSKLLDFENFRVQLGQSPLLSAFAGSIAWLVPILELLISLLLVLKRWRLIGLFAALSLMVMFTAYIYIILNYSSFIPCSCGGILEKLGWREHLFFNLVFIILAAADILILAGMVPKPHLISKPAVLVSAFSLSFLISFGIVGVLFKLSEDIIDHRNNFVRRFPGRAVKLHEIDLKVNSYYFAGFTDDKIYLGNQTAPLLVIALDTVLQKRSEFKIHLNRTDFQFQSTQLRISPPDFYLIDGSVPVVYKGQVKDWKAYMKWNGTPTFSHYELIDSLTLAFRSNSNTNGESILGSLHFGNEPKVHLNPNLLQKQIDGIFDVDGVLHYDKSLHKLVYTYLYRNEFIVADHELNLTYRGKTIDTISKAQIKVVEVTSRKERKLAAPPLIVNKASAVCKNLLFVNSVLPGKYEPAEMWKEASVIDIYDLNTNYYKGSFYIYHIKNEKLKNFFVLDNNFYGFIGKYLVHYKLSKGLTNSYQNKK
ncbi:MauE/DoxX family redox-associated membrane protein [Flavobacterium sp. PL02]|uniref:MauE/DoxX family redox-associated membrane protein n=1 Tax=Flavobacterium sp. PL02 TaxID=3088354 RepID=UPI002B2348CE|nr:MauE/DoxX family redox-associated membrane protein [Flavobacterium sp. PL02]MEA9412635.1 MauE/DoxX family redox-associated membrane protein [Flavobacterium sp. PL02]